MDTPRDIFVIGAPRSGTTWLQRLIASHPRMASPQETFFFSHYAAPIERQFAKHSGHLDDVAAKQGSPAATRRVNGLGCVLEHDDVDEWLRQGWSIVRDRTLALKGSATNVVEKSPSHGAHVELIRRVAQNPIFVHIIRDPRRAARSAQLAPWTNGTRADLVDSSRRWQRLVRQGVEAGIQGDDYVEIRYEALKDDPVAVLPQIFAAVGIELSEIEAQGIVADVADPNRNDSSELVLGGYATAVGLTAVEPVGFDIRTRGSHKGLTRYEEWLVLHNAPMSKRLGYANSDPVEWLRNAAYWLRYQPLRLAVRSGAGSTV